MPERHERQIQDLPRPVEDLTPAEAETAPGGRFTGRVQEKTIPDSVAVGPVTHSLPTDQNNLEVYLYPRPERPTRP